MAIPNYRFVDGAGKVPIQLLKTIIDPEKSYLLDHEITLYVPPGNVVVPDKLVFEPKELLKNILLSNTGKGPVQILSIRPIVGDGTTVLTGIDNVQSLDYSDTILPGEGATIAVDLLDNRFLDKSENSISIEYRFANVIVGQELQNTILSIIPNADISIYDFSYIMNDQLEETRTQIGVFLPDSPIGLPNKDLIIGFKLNKSNNTSINAGVINAKLTIPDNLWGDPYNNDPYTLAFIIPGQSGLTKNLKTAKEITIPVGEYQGEITLIYNDKNPNIRTDTNFTLEVLNNSRQPIQTYYMSFIPDQQQ
jgi:hypothetical protein